jgi:hypothetical protein
VRRNEAAIGAAHNAATVLIKTQRRDPPRLAQIGLSYCWHPSQLGLSVRRGPMAGVGRKRNVWFGRQNAVSDIHFSSLRSTEENPFARSASAALRQKQTINYFALRAWPCWKPRFASSKRRTARSGSKGPSSRVSGFHSLLCTGLKKSPPYT